MELGHPYGLYLRAIANVSELGEQMEFFETGLRYIETVHGMRAHDDDAEPVPRAWHSAQQQVYFALAAAGSPQLRRGLGGRLGELLQASAHRRGVAPVGALGTAVYRLWDVAIHLLSRRDRDGTAAVVAEHITAMSSAYFERVRLAMVNEYLWSHLASPFNIGLVPQKCQ